MPTFEVDDQFAFHSKTVRAGNEAIGVWVRAGAWCAAQLTDGFIPTEVAMTLCPPGSPPGTTPGTPPGSLSGQDGDTVGTTSGQSIWTRLVNVGLVDLVNGGFQLHDYLHWNRPASAIVQDRIRAAEKKRDQRSKMRAESKCPPGSPPGTPPGTPAGRPPLCPEGVPASPAPAPAPSQPDMREAKKCPQGTKRGRVETAIAADWQPSDKHRALASELGVDLAHCSEQFRDRNLATGDKYIDWEAAFRTWLRNAAKWSKKDTPLFRSRGSYPVQNSGGGVSYLRDLRARQEAASAAPVVVVECADV